MKVTRLFDLVDMGKMGMESLDNEKPQIMLGLATCGIAAGGLPLKEFAESYILENNIKADVLSVGCIGLCHAEPLVDIKLPGMPRVTYDNMDIRAVHLDDIDFDTVQFELRPLFNGCNYQRVTFGDAAPSGIAAQ